MSRSSAIAVFCLCLSWMIVGLAPCRHFVCRDPVDPSNPDICSRVDKQSSTLWIDYVGQCAESKTCRMNEVDEPARCLDNPEFYKFPGQKVTRPDLCLGTRVIDGMCRGKPLGEKCEHHIECDVGLRCGLDLLCDPAEEEHGRCDNDYLLCNSYLYCKEGTCIKYGSIPEGYPAGRGGADLCVTRYTNDHGVCDTPPKLQGPIYVDSTENLCVYSNNEQNRAVCGYHKDGKAICKPGAADMQVQWNQLLTYLNSKPRCVPYITDMGQCDFAIEMGTRPYLLGRIAYGQLHFFSILQEVQECMHRYVHPEFYEMLKAYNGAGTFSVFAAALIALLFLLL